MSIQEPGLSQLPVTIMSVRFSSWEDLHKKPPASINLCSPNLSATIKLMGKHSVTIVKMSSALFSQGEQQDQILVFPGFKVS